MQLNEYADIVYMLTCNIRKMAKIRIHVITATLMIYTENLEKKKLTMNN